MSVKWRQAEGIARAAAWHDVKGLRKSLGQGGPEFSAAISQEAEVPPEVAVPPHTPDALGSAPHRVAAFFGGFTPLLQSSRATTPHLPVRYDEHTNNGASGTTSGDDLEGALISHLVARARWKLLLALLLPVAAVYALLCLESSSIPIIDDFNDLLDFAVQLHQTPALIRKLSLVLTTQTGDYKLIFEHILVALQLLLLHRISFSLLLWIGNLLLLPVLFVLWRNAFPKANDLWERVCFFLPVPYLLFQLNFAENLDWALGSLQNIGVIAFGLLALDMLQSTKRGCFILACCFGVLSASASSNGFALVFAGGLILWKTRQLRRFAGWILTFVSALAFYCIDYQFPHVSASTASLSDKFIFFLSFLGAAAENMHGRPVHHASVALGAILLLWIAWVVRGGVSTEGELFQAASVCWILITAAMVANVRIGLGMQLALSVRYKIYCDLLLIFAYLLTVRRLWSHNRQSSLHWFYPTCLALAVLLSASSDILGYRFLQKRRNGIYAAMRAYESAPDSASPEYLPSDVPSSAELQQMEYQRIEMTRAVAAGLYRLPRLSGDREPIGKR